MDQPGKQADSHLRKKPRSQTERTGICWERRPPGYGRSADAAPHAPTARLSVDEKEETQPGLPPEFSLLTCIQQQKKYFSFN